jgi:maltokinase
VSNAVLEPFIAQSRWFGGKGRSFTVTRTEQVGTVGDSPETVVVLVEVTYAEGDTELYQLPISYYDEEQPRIDHALIGLVDGRFAYDAVHDRDAMSSYLRTFGAAPALDEVGSPAPDRGLRFVRLPGHELDLDAPPSIFSGEQSNSSVFFGEDAVLKLFRKVTAGENPDVTTHRALTEAGSTHVAALYGWIGYDDAQLGMLQQFLRTASDGWGQALASVRDLFAEADLHAEEVGGDFAGEAARLGEALAEVHAQLRDSFETSRLPASDVAAAMARRLDDAIEIVPELAAHADGARAVFAAMSTLDDLPVQRVHGDLHLGQTLRTVAGWKFVDFEGEPAKPLTERVAPDSPWRDVAAMTRSFDYAPHAVAASLPEDSPDESHQRQVRADEWARRNRRAFLASYCGGELGPEDKLLLTAYVVDKAVYECVYETRNRPTWLSIPLEGVARLTS